MRKNILLLAFVCSITLSAQNEVKIDTSKSSVKWTGSSLFQFNKHFGTVKFVKGNIVKKHDSIIGGTFEIDMNSIANTDGNFSEDLVDHLKSSDFFETETFPISRLEITEIKYRDSNHLEIRAKLTIKDITQTIKYRSQLENINGKIIMKSKFIIDRTRWKINYESKGFSNNVKDAIISDAIEFEVVVSTMINQTNYIKTSSGLQYKILKEGTGLPTKHGDKVLIQETTSYLNGTVLFSNESPKYPLEVKVGANQIIKGVEEGLHGMQTGEIRELIIPHYLAKRKIYPDHISPDSTLVVKIILNKILPTK